jgi:hypothetical protein
LTGWGNEGNPVAIEEPYSGITYAGEEIVVNTSDKESHPLFFQVSFCQEWLIIAKKFFCKGRNQPFFIQKREGEAEMETTPSRNLL